jgi:ABC-type glutathione transport system ATPase component
MSLLEVNNLDVTYGSGRRATPVVSEVSFTLGAREVLALVGESGSGKTTVARAIVGLLDPSAGEILFDGTNLAASSRRSRLQRRDIQMVFQDPRSSLNPRMTVRALIAEAWRAHPDAAPAGPVTEAIVSLLDQVGLPDSVLGRRPSQLSGGQCQRVSIARVLALRPRLIVCDEAVSALDVSVQAQILRLLVQLTATHNLSLLFITHDLGVVRQIADRVAVMQHGRVVEIAPTEQLFTAPADDYSRELLSAALDIQL